MFGLEFLRTQADRKLTHLRTLGTFRTLVATPAGMVTLCSNDYLGVLQDEEWQRQLRQRLTLPGGAGASRLLGGEHPIFAEAEREFAEFKRAESALLFPSGYAANEAVIQSLAQLEGVRFFSDQLNHASIIDGLRLARLDRGQRPVYAHADMAALEQALSQSDADVNIIMTESLFSMDGDIAPLRELHRLASRYRGVLVVDEAHAVGVYGESGAGLLETAGLQGAETISVNTLGKALGLQGAFVAGPQWLRDLIVNLARPFIYTTGPSPWLAEATVLTLRELPAWSERRRKLAHHAQWLREQLSERGVNIGNSQSAIIPLIVGSANRAVELADHLIQQGFFVRAIRPPTVSADTCRVRLSLTAAMQESDVQRLATSIIDWFERS